VQNPERVISRDELLNEVWGYQNYPSTRTVDNHILKLRQKLERDPANPVHFRTVHGVGYSSYLNASGRRATLVPFDLGAVPSFSGAGCTF